MLNPSLPVASRTRSRMEAYWSEVCPPGKRRHTRERVVLQDPNPITTSSLPSKKDSGEIRFLYEAPTIDIHRRKQDSRHPANISNLDYNDDEEEEEEGDDDEDEDNDDSMEDSDEALTSPSEEDNDESEDLEYGGEEEKDVVYINDYDTEPKPKSKGKKVGAASASSRKLHLLTVVADAILENVDSDSNKVLEVESENNSLPIKFSFEVENTVTSNNGDIVDDELESLWTEMQFCLASDGIASKPSLVLLN